MPSDVTGDVVRNLIAIRRLSNGLAADVSDDVRALVDEFVAELMRGDPTAVTRNVYRQARIDAVLAKFREVAAGRYPEMRRRLEAALARIGKQQAGWAASTLDRGVGEIGAVEVRLTGIGLDRFRTITRTEPFHGRLMREWFSSHQNRTLGLVRQQVRLGMVQNESIGDIVRRIRGRSVGSGRFSGGVLATSTRDAEAIARTAVNFISNRGHIEAYEANADVLTGVQFTATLDSRTTPICASHDGRVWAMDDPGKMVPPLHVNCRSVLVPVVDWKSLGVDPPDEGTRASAGGQVPSSTTYADWFRRQSKTEQDRIIGPARAELFRSGKIDFRSMIGQDNRILRLDELSVN
jgi:SPP1 gp7 family putative phage head morphogenesis protein